MSKRRADSGSSAPAADEDVDAVVSTFFERVEDFHEQRRIDKTTFTLNITRQVERNDMLDALRTTINTLDAVRGKDVVAEPKKKKSKTGACTPSQKLTILVKKAETIAIGWRDGDFVQEGEVVDLNFDLTSPVKDMNDKQLLNLIHIGNQVRNSAIVFQAHMTFRLGELVCALMVWAKKNAKSVSGGSNAVQSFKDRIKQLKMFGLTKAHGLLNFFVLCSVHPCFKFVAPHRDVIDLAHKIKKHLDMKVGPLRLVFSQPAPSVVIKKMDEVVLASREAQSEKVLEMIDEKASDKLNPDALDGHYDDEAFIEQQQQDVECEFKVVEPTAETQTINLEEQADGTFNQTHTAIQHGGATQQQHHNEQMQATQQDTQALLDAGNDDNQDDVETQDMSASSADGELAKLIGNIDITSKTQTVSFKFFVGDFEQEIVKDIDVDDSINKMFKDFKFRDAPDFVLKDFVVKECRDIETPVVNKDEPLIEFKDNTGATVDGCKLNKGDKFAAMADYRNTILFLGTTNGIGKFTKCRQQMAATGTSATGSN